MTPVTIQRPQSTESDSFEQHAASVLSRLRAVLASTLATFDGGNALRTATDLQRTLGINSKLSWQIHKLATAGNPLAAGGHVPKPAAMKRFLEAVIERGASTEHIEAVKQAMREFDRLVNSHAGERVAFDSMISAAAGGEAADQNDLRLRRQAFLAQRHIFGVQAATRLSCYIVQPSPGKDTIDAASIRGTIGLRRLRRDATCLLSSAKVVDTDGVTARKVAFEPLDPRSRQSHGVSFLTDFCTKPMPETRSFVDAEGYVVTELASHKVGNTGAITIIIGDVVRNAETRFRDSQSDSLDLMTGIRKPCEVLIFDLLLHEGTYGNPTPTPRGMIYSDADERQLPLRNRRSVLSANEPVIYLGKGPSVLHTPDVPHYAEMAHYVFETLGWDAERFEVYRCRVEYPVMPSTVVVQFDLPEKPPE